MRLIFAGTPDFAVPCLSALLSTEHSVVAVYTQPDRPAGRGRRLQASPVKQLATDAGIPVFQPTTLKDPQAQQALAALEADLMIVVAYGLLLPQAVLDAPVHGCWNVHASLLPRWRGAAPIQRALIAGDAETGVCLMQMERGLDTGPVLLPRRCAIDPTDNAITLHQRLSEMGAVVLTEGLAMLAGGNPPLAVAQPEEGVSYAHKLERREARVDWHNDAAAIELQVRGLAGWPVAEAEIGGELVKLHEVSRYPGASPSNDAGEIIESPRGRLVIACGSGAIEVLRLQRAGGKAMFAADFLNARQDLRR